MAKKKSKKAETADVQVDFITPADAPVFAEDEPMSVLEEPAPLNYESAPLDDEPALLDDEPVSLEDEPVPLEDEPVPLEDEPVPLEDEPVPLEEEPVPLEDESMLSPYVSRSCYVYFKNKIPFIVPRDLLRHAGNILSVSSVLPGDGPNDIRMEEVPDDAGHVLVHYLYTGTWQTLRQRHSQQEPTAFSDSNISVTKADFETRVHVYCAAKAYGLTSLVELAKGEVQQLASLLTPLDVVVSASESCQLLAEDDIWFRSFLQGRLSFMFNTSKYEDESVFLGCIRLGTVFSNFLMKSMFLLCCQKAQNSRVLPVADEGQSVFGTNEGHLNGWETTIDVPADRHFTCASQAEPLAEETKVSDTPPSDDWAMAEQPTSEEYAEPVDYVPEPLPEAISTGPATKSKKDKKKPKKGKLSERNERVLIDNGAELVSEPGPEHEYEAEREIAPAVQDEEWGTRFAKGNERDGLTSSVLQPDPVEEPGVQPVLEGKTGSKQDIWAIWGMKQGKEKSETAMTPEQVKELEPEPEAIPAAEEDPWGSWGGELPKPKKKKGKKLEGINKKKTKTPEIVPDASNPESGAEPGAETTMVMAEDWTQWGFPKPKKQKTPKKAQVIMPALDCPDRVTHILDGGWTECSTCREQVCSISGQYKATQAKELDPLLV